MTPRYGITLPLLGFDLRATQDIAREAEALGYTDAWTAEVSGPDGFSSASVMGAATESMRIGLAIAPVFTRPPALLAMSALAAQQASGGRFALGLGASTPTIVDNWMGLSSDKPVARMRETIEIIRSAFAGEKIVFDGDAVHAKGFRLEGAGGPPPEIFLASLGPRMMETAAASADGIILFATCEEGVRIANEAAPDKEIAARLICVPDKPEDEVRGFARWLLAPYLAAKGYNHFVARQGFEEEAKAVSTAWYAGDRNTAVEAVSDRLVDALILMGSSEAIKERVEGFREVGLDTPVLMLVVGEGPEAARQAMKNLAPT